MNENIENFTIDDVNKNLNATIKYMLSKPINELIAFAAFTDREKPNNDDTLTDLISPSYKDVVNIDHIKLLNDIETLIKKYINDNANFFDPSTYDSALDSLVSLSANFFLEKETEILNDLIYKHKKNVRAWWVWAATIIMHRELSLFAFNQENYHVAILLHETGKEIHLQTVFENLQFMKSHKRELSRKNSKSTKVRWQGHVEQLRRNYLKLDEQRQNKLGKNLTIKFVARWIYEHHNQDDLEYETIRDHLSKARKGIFTND